MVGSIAAGMVLEQKLRPTSWGLDDGGGGVRAGGGASEKEPKKTRVSISFGCL